MTLCLNQLLNTLRHAKVSIELHPSERDDGEQWRCLSDAHETLDNAIAMIEDSFPLVNYTVTWTTKVLAKSAAEAVGRASARLMHDDRHYIVEWDACGHNRVVLDAAGNTVKQEENAP